MRILDGVLFLAATVFVILFALHGAFSSLSESWIYFAVSSTIVLLRLILWYHVRRSP